MLNIAFYIFFLIMINQKHYGYFVFGKDMLNVDLTALHNNGVTDLFLNY